MGLTRLQEKRNSKKFSYFGRQRKKKKQILPTLGRSTEERRMTQYLPSRSFGSAFLISLLYRGAGAKTTPSLVSDHSSLLPRNSRQHSRAPPKSVFNLDRCTCIMIHLCDGINPARLAASAGAMLVIPAGSYDAQTRSNISIPPSN